MDDTRLSEKARGVIVDQENELYVSAASGWEIAIKARLGKVSISENVEEFVPQQIAMNGFTVLPIEMAHALRVYDLPDINRDPFDRILVTQSQIEKMPVLTKDPAVGRYEVETIW